MGRNAFFPFRVATSAFRKCGYFGLRRREPHTSTVVTSPLHSCIDSVISETAKRSAPLFLSDGIENISKKDWASKLQGLQDRSRGQECARAVLDPADFESEDQ